MPILHRVRGDNIHYHIILRCNNREQLFCKPEDFELILALFRETKEKFGYRLYNYELLNAHAHLMLSTHQGYHVDEIMHNLCLQCAKQFNKRNNRSGHLWAHRYRSRIILNDAHGITCLRYQHRNALSAGLVFRPEDWPWSGYSFYAYGEANNLLEYHPSFLALHELEDQRRCSYRRLVNTIIPSDKITGLLEKGSDRLTWRFANMIRQVSALKSNLQIG